MAFFETFHCGREQKFIALAAILYTVMHAGILFIPFAIFWDDWVTVGASSDMILETYKEAGAMFNLVAYMHIGMSSIGIWSYKVFTFLLMGASGYFLNAILRRNGAFGDQLRWSIVLLFMLLPFNMARVAIIDFPYVLCYALFFGGWLLMDRHRILAAILFFLSFNTNSLLVFYALPIFDMLYRSSERRFDFALIRFAVARWYFFVLPFLYYGIKLCFFKPTGFYAGYNQHYSLLAIPLAMVDQVKDLANLKFNFFVLLGLVPIIYFPIKKILYSQKCEDNIISPWSLMVLGAVVIFVGGFPYWILSYIPTFMEWTSRHQLLMPLGSAIVISSALLLIPGKVRAVSLVVIVAACLSYGLVSYFNFYVDWQKQLFVIEKLKRDPVVAEARFLIIEDRAKELDAIGRTYRFYEWNGILVLALGDELRFALEPKDIDGYAKGEFDKFFHSLYKAGEHVRSVKQSVAVVKLNLKAQGGMGLSLRLMPEIEYESRLLSPEEWAKMTVSEKLQRE
ncbi:hypothetical protein [Pseudomonas hormoni]